MLARPGLSIGSSLAPPANAKSSATSGTAGSRTSQASMPPGLTTRSMLVAARAEVTESPASITAASTMPAAARPAARSEEHTSELQSLRHLVCRLLLEKKKVQLGTHRTRSAFYGVYSF